MIPNAPPEIPEVMLPLMENPAHYKPMLTMVVKRRKVWVASKDEDYELVTRILVALMVPMVSFILVLALFCVIWSRSSFATKKKIHYEVHKTGILLTKVMERPEVYESPRCTLNAIAFWSSMTFLLGVYCVGITLGYDTKRGRPRK